MQTILGLGWLVFEALRSSLRRITCDHKALDSPHVHYGAGVIIWKRRCLNCGANVVEGVR